MSDEVHDEHENALVVPFVVCKSGGGTLDDHAFVCGARYSDLRHRLKSGRPTVLSDYEYPALRPQLELLAMELNYTFTAESYDEDWDFVTFSIGSPANE
jgi:hypothetical protein